jgi:FtsP/CotA-like multicopper oxidase with cupredoxin domain
VTSDTHPIHVHLVQFQIVSRQAFDQDRYLVAWLTLNGTCLLLMYKRGGMTEELYWSGLIERLPKWNIPGTGLPFAANSNIQWG